VTVDWERTSAAGMAGIKERPRCQRFLRGSAGTVAATGAAFLHRLGPVQRRLPAPRGSASRAKGFPDCLGPRPGFQGIGAVKMSEPRPLVLASASWSISLGQDLRDRLDALAREQGGDAVWLGRRIVREYVEQHERRARRRARPCSKRSRPGEEALRDG
jgi:hypothetical protein